MGRRVISYKSRKIIIVLSVIVTLIFALLITIYLYIHSYINKMNIVTTSNITTESNSTADNLQLAREDIISASNASEPVLEDVVPELEDVNLDTPDSSNDEIKTIEDEIRKNMEENSTPIRYDKNVFNVLLIGSDSREVGDLGRSDAMLIVSINKKTKTITVTSLLRDIYLQIPGKNNNRINAAYAYGGAELLMDTIEQNFKIQINQYTSINFYAFIDIIDAIGGVTIEVSDKEIPIINEYVKELNYLTGQEELKDCLTEPGTLLLNGKQALGYSRNRYVGNADFERTARQRRVLEQVFKKVKELNLIQLKDLLNIVLPQVTTNLTEGEIFTLILSLPAYIDYDIDQWSIPMADSYSFLKIRGMSVLGIDFDKNIKELHNRIYGENFNGK